jgi:hypothetical protein
MEGSGSVQIMTDPEDPKTYLGYGSGYTKLLDRMFLN